MWSPQNILGLLCLIAAAVVPWIFPDEAGRGMGSSLTVLGGMLLGWAPPAPVLGVKPPPAAPPASRGMARIDGLVIAAAVGATVAVFVALLGSGGCGAAQVRAEKSVSLDVTPGPPCVIVVRADGEIVSTVKGPQRCAVVVAP
jgi:hypothetical protein